MTNLELGKDFYNNDTRRFCGNVVPKTLTNEKYEEIGKIISDKMPKGEQVGCYLMGWGNPIELRFYHRRPKLVVEITWPSHRVVKGQD